MRTTGKATDLITFSRSSGGTALRKIAYGPELVTNGTFDSDATGATPATWETNNANASLIKQADGTALFSSTSFAYARIQNASRPVLPTGLYKVSFDISEWATGLLNVHVGLGTGGNVVTGNGSYSYIFESTAEQAYEFQLRPNSGGTGSFKIDNISVKEVLFDQGDLTLFNHPADIPRIEYDANGNVLGLLVEESRTNANKDSNFGAGWNAANSSLQLNAGVSPDNQSNAVKLSVNTDNLYHAIYDAMTSGTYMVSVYAKAGEYNGIQITGTNTTNDHACFNLSDGTSYHQGSNVSNASIQEVGNGWYRCSAKIPITNGSLYIAVIDGISTAWLPAFAGANSTDGIYIFGLQAELNASFPTSYIPTSGSTATRAADVASIATSEFGYRDDDGSWVIESQVNADVSNTRLAVLTDGNSNSRILSAGSSLFQGFVSDNGATVNITTGSFPVDTPTKLSFGWAENNSAISLDGSAVVEDLNCTIPTSITYMAIGSNYLKNPNGSASLHIKSIKYIPRRLTNDQLVEITS